MMNNPLQMMNLIKNPQAFLQQVMNDSQFMQNPVARNTIEMMQKGDRKGTEEIARNLLKTKGIDPDEFYKQVQSQFGIK